MRGICLSKENALFFGIALRPMNCVYNKPAQEVAPTGPPGKVPGLPRLRTSASPGTFHFSGGQSGWLPVRGVAGALQQFSQNANRDVSFWIFPGRSGALFVYGSDGTHFNHATIKSRTKSNVYMTNAYPSLW